MFRLDQQKPIYTFNEIQSKLFWFLSSSPMVPNSQPSVAVPLMLLGLLISSIQLTGMLNTVFLIAIHRQICQFFMQKDKPF